MHNSLDTFAQFRIKIKIGPVTVSRPRLYARTPPIQNLGETEVAWEKDIFLVFLGTFFHKKARARAHVHVGHVV